MDAVKILSKILFYLARLLAAIYLGSAFHSMIALATGWSLVYRENAKFFSVCFPFTQTPFLTGDNNFAYMVFGFLVPMSLYGVFFLLLSNVFKVFFQARLFTENHIKHLRWFYLANLILPTVVTLLSRIFSEVDEIAGVLIGLHFLIGIFTYFLAAIFKQGVHLQNEQDLIV